MKQHPGHLLLFFALFFFQAPHLFPAGGDGSLPPAPAGESAPPAAGNTGTRLLIGSAETLLTNAVVLGFNVLFQDAYWATPSAGIIRQNLSSSWQWEVYDGFVVNQIGHPFQGSTYFNAGRVNGFGFYQSFFFNALGSSTWEAFCEGDFACLNDFITTVTGSSAVGEIFYRLYLEASAAGAPALLTALFNPIAGFHRLATGWEPPARGGNIYRLETRISAGAARAGFSTDSGRELFGFQGFTGTAGFSVIYGDPFQQESHTPFDHFEFALSAGMNPGEFIDLRVVSDGYLFSFSPALSGAGRMSTGLSLHFDLTALGRFDFYNSTLDHYSNALDWTVKYSRPLPGGFTAGAKIHAGVTFFGTSEYYPSGMEETGLKYYGPGFNTKCDFSLEHEKAGRLSARVFNYFLWSYPGTSALEEAVVYWLFADAAYFFPVTRQLSLGISGAFALERGSFGSFPGSRKRHNAAGISVSWNF